MEFIFEGVMLQLRSLESDHSGGGFKEFLGFSQGKHEGSHLKGQVS